MKGMIWGVGFCQELKGFWNRPLVHSFSHPANFHPNTPPTNPLFPPFSSPLPTFHAPYFLLRIHFSYPPSTHPLATRHSRATNPTTNALPIPLYPSPALPTSTYLTYPLFSSLFLPLPATLFSPYFFRPPSCLFPSLPLLSLLSSYIYILHNLHNFQQADLLFFSVTYFSRSVFSPYFPFSISHIPFFHPLISHPLPTYAFPFSFLPFPSFSPKTLSHPQKLHKLIFTLFPISPPQLPQKPLKTATFHHFPLSQADLGFLPLLSFV